MLTRRIALKVTQKKRKKNTFFLNKSFETFDSKNLINAPNNQRLER